MRKRKSHVFALFMVLVLILLSLPMAAGAAPQPDVVVTIAVDQEAFAADQNVVVHVTITNAGNHPAKVLKWYTPIDGVEESLFAVSTGGAPVAYLGPVYKRPEPKFNDYIHLKAGESVTSDVDLGAYYDLSATGGYAVRYEVTSADPYSEKNTGPAKTVDSLTSNELSLLIEGRLTAVPAEAISPAAGTGGTAFNKCTTTQQTTLLSARVPSEHLLGRCAELPERGHAGIRAIPLGSARTILRATIPSRSTSAKSATPWIPLRLRSTAAARRSITPTSIPPNPT